MKQFLYSHNLNAYESVKAHYAEGNRKACVVHATGTGKSYIIAALAEDYERVLLVAPNDYVLDQVRRNAGNKLRYMTYAKLMTDARKGIISSNCYDLIVFDEYHRAGAEQWGEGVQSIIQSNPQALIFGTTATDVRYLDERRNMSDELFEGHIVSVLTIGEAWARKILPSPIYVCTLEDFEETERSCHRRISDSKMDEGEKKAFADKLASIRKDWENVGGVSSIIRKHLPDGVHRILVFCPDIQSTARYRKLVKEWFAKAGIKLEQIYVIESSRKPSANKREMKRFQEEGEDGVKVMISVNMLNEGIHVPHVDAIIMLRGTASGNIYLQQLGRCMHTGTVGRRPVVLDLANNIDSAFSESSVAFERKAYTKAVKELSEEPESEEPGDFIEVVDYLMEVREVLAKIEERMAYCERWEVWEKNYQEAKEFYETHGRFPYRKENKRLYCWAYQWMTGTRGKNYPERLLMIQDIGWELSARQSWEDSYEEAKKFYEEHGYFPHCKENKRLYDWASQWMRKYENVDSERTRLIKSIGWKRKKHFPTWEENYAQAKRFYDEHGSFPTSSQQRVLHVWAQRWMKNHAASEPDKADMLRNIGWKCRGEKTSL